MKITRKQLQVYLASIIKESIFPSMDQLGVAILSQGEDKSIGNEDDVLEHLGQGLSEKYSSLPVFNLARIDNNTEIQALYSSISRGQSDGNAGEFIVAEALKKFFKARYGDFKYAQNINNAEFVQGVGDVKTDNFYGEGVEAFPAFDLILSNTPRALDSVSFDRKVINLPHLISVKFSGTVSVSRTEAKTGVDQGMKRQTASVQRHSIGYIGSGDSKVVDGKNIVRGMLCITMGAIFNTSTGTLASLKSAAIEDYRSGDLRLSGRDTNIPSWLFSQGVEEIHCASHDGINLSAVPYLDHGATSSETRISIKDKPVYLALTSQSGSKLSQAMMSLSTKNVTAARHPGVETVVFDSNLASESIQHVLGLLSIGSVERLVSLGGDPSILVKRVSASVALRGVLGRLEQAAGKISQILPAGSNDDFVVRLVNSAIRIDTTRRDPGQQAYDMKTNLSTRAGHAQLYDLITDAFSAVNQSMVSAGYHLDNANKYYGKAARIISDLSLQPNTFHTTTVTVLSRTLKQQTVLSTISLLRQLRRDSRIYDSMNLTQKKALIDSHNEITGFYNFLFSAGFLSDSVHSKLRGKINTSSTLLLQEFRDTNKEVSTQLVMFVDSLNDFHENINQSLQKLFDAVEELRENIIKVESEEAKMLNPQQISTDKSNKEPFGQEDRTAAALNTNSNKPILMQVPESKIYESILRELMKYSN